MEYPGKHSCVISGSSRFDQQQPSKADHLRVTSRIKSPSVSGVTWMVPFDSFTCAFGLG